MSSQRAVGQKPVQSARHLSKENLSPLRKGIEKQLIGLKNNVDKLALSTSIARSKTLGALVLDGPSRH